MPNQGPGSEYSKMSEADIWSHLSEGERNVLKNIGVEMDFLQMKFTSEPSWGDFTLAFAYISALDRRNTGEPDKYAWVIGDCVNEGYRLFGKKKVDDWLVEFDRVIRLRDIALNLTGALLIHLQTVEYYVKGCCAYLDIKGVDISPGDVLSTDGQRRKYTLGRMATGLRKTDAFNEEFQLRLTDFVERRNHFIHEFWNQRITSKERDYGIPSVSDYEDVIRFIRALGSEAAYMEKVFQGLLYDILLEVGRRHWPDKVDEMPFQHWQEYMNEYREVLRRGNSQSDSA